MPALLGARPRRSSSSTFTKKKATRNYDKLILCMRTMALSEWQLVRQYSERPPQSRAKFKMKSKLMFCQAAKVNPTADRARKWGEYLAGDLLN